MKETTFATIPSGARTIVLAGELDIATRAELAEKFEGAAEHSSDITVDMTAVTYMDSSAIGALIGLHRQLGEAGRHLNLRMRRNAALRLLEIAGLTSVLDIDVAG